MLEVVEVVLFAEDAGCDALRAALFSIGRKRRTPCAGASGGHALCAAKHSEGSWSSGQSFKSPQNAWGELLRG